MELLGPKGVADAYNERTGESIIPETARGWMRSGKLPGAQPFGSTYIIERAALEAALERGIEKYAHDKPGNGWPWLTSYEVRERLAEAGIDVVHYTVLTWLQNGVLPGQKVGRAWAVSREQLERMLAEGFRVPTPGRPPKDAG